MEKGRVRWFMSINYDTIPEDIKAEGMRTYRTISIDGDAFEFSGGFTDLHTKSYEKILAGEGFGIHECRQAVQIVHDIRKVQPVGLKGDYHPMAGLEIAKHPFE